MSKVLPDGWRWVRLGEVCDFLDSRRVPVNDVERAKRIAGKTQSELFPYYGANGQVGWIDGYLFAEPLILLAEDGGNFGSRDKPIAYAVSGRYWVNNHAHVLKPRPSIDLEYCLHALRIRPDVGELVSGSTRAKLNQEIASGIPIPLPPSFSDQKRIAAILNEQMAAVECARAAANAQLEAAKALPAAYLRAAFNSPEAQQWPMTRVSQICDSIDYGFTASAHYEVGEPRFLRITDIQDGSVDWEKVPGCRINSDEESRYRLMDGDIVFARTGATTGKSYLMRHPPRAVFASYLIRIRPSPTVTAEYLYAFFQSDRYWQQIRAAMRGGAQPNVNATLLGALALPLPSLSEQRQIALRLSEEMAVAEKTRKAVEAQFTAINALPAALLRRAFSGEGLLGNS